MADNQKTPTSVVCLVCGDERKNNRSLGLHVSKAHHMSGREYRIKFDLLRVCQSCNRELSRHCSGNLCNHCRDRRGANNPFYGKTHSDATRAFFREHSSRTSKMLWKDKAYRDKVINGISKPRTQKFRDEQSARITQWYKDHPEQRYIRSVTMSRNWRRGVITKSKSRLTRWSEVEMKLFQDVLKIDDCAVSGKTIHFEDSWYFPDILLPSFKIIIEFFGDFWHMNPDKYTPDDINSRSSLSAKDVWARDARRISALEEAGFSPFIIWESEYQKYPKVVLDRLDAFINWESCSY